MEDIEVYKFQAVNHLLCESVTSVSCASAHETFDCPSGGHSLALFPSVHMCDYVFVYDSQVHTWFSFQEKSNSTYNITCTPPVVRGSKGDVELVLTSVY